MEFLLIVMMLPLKLYFFLKEIDLIFTCHDVLFNISHFNNQLR